MHGLQQTAVTGWFFSYELEWRLATDDEICSVVFETNVSLQDRYNTEFISTVPKLVDIYTCRWEYCDSPGFIWTKNFEGETGGRAGLMGQRGPRG